MSSLTDATWVEFEHWLRDRRGEHFRFDRVTPSRQRTSGNRWLYVPATPFTFSIWLGDARGKETAGFFVRPRESPRLKSGAFILI
jgi:hypothetical protein